MKTGAFASIVQALPAFSFSSCADLPGDGFARYRDLYSHGVDAVQEGERFSAEVRAWNLDRIMLFDRRLRHVRHERSAHRIRRDGFAHFAVHLNLGGEFHCNVGDVFRTVAPSEVLLVDMSRPMTTYAPEVHVVTLSVARDLVQTGVAGGADLHGKVLDVNRAGLLADYIEALSNRAATLGLDAVPATTRVFADLLSVALDPEPASHPPAKVRLDGLRRDAARRFIDIRLSSPDLSPEQIADAIGVSRPTVYRLFQPEGGVAAYIRGRRLARLKAMLATFPQPRSLAELSVACGLGSERQCTRVFQHVVGMTPAEFAADACGAHAPLDATHHAKRKMALWIASL